MAKPLLDLFLFRSWSIMVLRGAVFGFFVVFVSLLFLWWCFGSGVSVVVLPSRAEVGLKEFSMVVFLSLLFSVRALIGAVVSGWRWSLSKACVQKSAVDWTKGLDEAFG